MPESTTIVIFGASGDLAHRKLLPALFNLYRKKRVPENFQIIGFATRPWDDQKFRSEMEGAAMEFCAYDYSYGAQSTCTTRPGILPNKKISNLWRKNWRH